VFKLVPSKYITQNEIDAANQVHYDELNVQNQPKIVWPKNLIVARAYVDQLARGNSLSTQKISALNAALAKNDASQLKSLGTSLEKEAKSAKTPADAERMRALADIFKR
jgi:hypothetical protein